MSIRPRHIDTRIPAMFLFAWLAINNVACSPTPTMSTPQIHPPDAAAAITRQPGDKITNESEWKAINSQFVLTLKEKLKLYASLLNDPDPAKFRLNIYNHMANLSQDQRYLMNEPIIGTFADANHMLRTFGTQPNGEIKIGGPINPGKVTLPKITPADKLFVASHETKNITNKAIVYNHLVVYGNAQLTAPFQANQKVMNDCIDELLADVPQQHRVVHIIMGQPDDNMPMYNPVTQKLNPAPTGLGAMGNNIVDPSDSNIAHLYFYPQRILQTGIEFGMSPFDTALSVATNEHMDLMKKGFDNLPNKPTEAPVSLFTYLFMFDPGSLGAMYNPQKLLPGITLMTNTALSRATVSP